MLRSSVSSHGTFLYLGSNRKQMWKGEMVKDTLFTLTVSWGLWEVCCVSGQKQMLQIVCSMPGRAADAFKAAADKASYLAPLYDWVLQGHLHRNSFSCFWSTFNFVLFRLYFESNTMGDRALVMVLAIRCFLHSPVKSANVIGSV